jgi:predicted metal-dependent hydrolase
MRTLQQRHRAELRRTIPSLLEKWEPQVGVGASRWGIRRMKTKEASPLPASGLASAILRVSVDSGAHASQAASVTVPRRM